MNSNCVSNLNSCAQGMFRSVLKNSPAAFELIFQNSVSIEIPEDPKILILSGVVPLGIVAVGAPVDCCHCLTEIIIFVLNVYRMFWKIPRL